MTKINATFATFPLSNVNTGVFSNLPPKIHLRYTCAFRTRVGSFSAIFRKFTPIRCIVTPSLSYFTSSTPLLLYSLLLYSFTSSTPLLLTPLPPLLLTPLPPYSFTPHLLSKKNYKSRKSLRRHLARCSAERSQKSHLFCVFLLICHIGL